MNGSGKFWLWLHLRQASPLYGTFPLYGENYMRKLYPENGYLDTWAMKQKVWIRTPRLSRFLRCKQALYRSPNLPGEGRDNSLGHFVCYGQVQLRGSVPRAQTLAGTRLNDTRRRKSEQPGGNLLLTLLKIPSPAPRETNRMPKVPEEKNRTRHHHKKWFPAIFV